MDNDIIKLSKSLLNYNNKKITLDIIKDYFNITQPIDISTCIFPSNLIHKKLRNNGLKNIRTEKNVMEYLHYYLEQKWVYRMKYCELTMYYNNSTCLILDILEEIVDTIKTN